MCGVVLEKMIISSCLEEKEKLSGRASVRMNTFGWMVVEEVPANGIDMFNKNVRRKYKSGIGILRNTGKSSNSSQHVQVH